MLSSDCTIYKAVETVDLDRVLLLVFALCVSLSIHVSEESRRGHRLPGAGVKGSCEAPDVGAGNQTCLLQEQYLLLLAEPPL